MESISDRKNGEMRKYSPQYKNKEEHMPFLQTFYYTGFPNRLLINPLRKVTAPKNLAQLCKSLHHLQTFAARSLSFASCDPSIPPVTLPHALFLSEPYTTHHTPSTLFPFLFFVVKSRPSSTAKTGRTGRVKPHPYRTKSIVFAKKSLPDFVAISCPSTTYRNLKSSFFRTFSQICEKTGFHHPFKKHERNYHGNSSAISNQFGQ